ncbi:MAG TPA: transcription termination factor NusA, partial [Stellaceae bacterium]|nr:transcription termination factor NusA [Stellaceae bacterium]
MATQTAANYPRLELLQVADTVARDKGIDRDEVLQAMEQAIQKAGRSKYGQEYDIRAEIDRKSGEIKLMRFREVAEPVVNEATQIPLEAAKKINPEAEIGDFLTDPLPPIDFGRIAAQTAKQVIVQKVRDAERQRQFKEFKDRVGEIVNGLVKRVEFGNVVVDLGRAEAILRRDELLPRESFRQGERVRAYIYDVRQEVRGPQIFLSRTHPQFMAKLFAQEVPEIYDGIIEIRAVARDPGSRAKIAVISNDSGIDPVGACVGMRGSRVQAVVAELQGEKIDIIPWSQDPATFVVNALAPAEVAKVVMDEEQRRIEVVVPDDQLSLAIGRRGQNVRLASQLTGWDIDILTEAEESERRQEEFRTRSALFIQALDVDDVIAHLLVTEGFTSVEDVAFVPLNELSGIEGFEEDVAKELQQRAQVFIK